MRNEILWSAAALFVAVFLLTVAAETRLVPYLRRRRAGQPILEIGPSWHLAKAGTPTLGGLAFILAMLLAALFFVPLGAGRFGESWQKLSLLLLFAALCGAIGFIDDRCKLAHRRNQGLTAWQKYLLQLAAAGIFLLFAEVFVGLSHEIPVPFTDRVWDLGIFYYPLAVLYLTGLVNALNLTDGVDGLLSSLAGVFAVFLLLWGTKLLDGEMLFVAAMLLGGALGFLCFNAHPAKVFMGDTGSLFLGAMVAGYGILSPSPLVVLIACGVFVIEALSVILQVFWFKVTGGKRLFLMAPLHHHFEKIGWSENRVVAVFGAAAALFAVLAFLGGR